MMSKATRPFVPVFDRKRKLTGLFKRETAVGSGRWTYTFFEYIGKKKIPTALPEIHSDTAAIEWFRSREELAEARGGARRTPKTIRFSEVVAICRANTRAYIERRERYGDDGPRRRVISEWSTFQTFETNLDKYILPFFASDPYVHTIDGEQVTALLNWVREQPGRGTDPATGRQNKASEAVVNSVKSAMSTVCKEALALKAHYYNPTRDVLDRDKPIPGPRATYKKPILRPEQLRSLIEVAETTLAKLVIALLVISGLRSSALLGARWSDWEEDGLLITAAIGRKKGAPVFLKGTKNGKPNAIPLDSFVRRLLVLHRAAEREAGYGRDGDFIFRSPDAWLLRSKNKERTRPGQPITRHYVLNTVKAAGKAAGLGEKVTPLAIRSSVSTALTDADLGEKRIDLILGNTAPTRSKHYNGLYKDEAEKQHVHETLQAIGLHAAPEPAEEAM